VNEAFFAFDVKPAPGSEGVIDTQVLGAHVERGAPTNTPNAPFHVMDTFVEGVASSTDSTTTQTLHQISVTLVTETFQFIRGEVLAYDVSAGGDGFFTFIRMQAPEGSTDENIIGFTVFHDMRTFVEDFRIFGDLNCDGKVDVHDIDAMEIAIDSREEFEIEYPGCRWVAADLDDDGDVDDDDLDALFDEIDDDDSRSDHNS